jgi:hypothetical protein
VGMGSEGKRRVMLYLRDYLTVVEVIVSLGS